MQDSPAARNSLFDAHPRAFAANCYVYPVLSRRAGGISIGVNLSLDRACNFHCVYCQVDRSRPAEASLIDLERLAAELDATIELVTSGRIYAGPQFGHTPRSLRLLKDIALSGDGEPTANANLDRVVEVCAEAIGRHELPGVKIVLISNASLFHLPRVRRALERLDASGGEIWAKLDAGSEDYYRLVNRSEVPWRQILDNLREAAVARPIVMQSIWMRIWDRPPPPAELEAYCDRLGEIVAAGGRIKLVQIHTMARKPGEQWVAALGDAEVDGIAELVRRRTGLPAAAFYGSG
jgi:wyosine [tRNA(Phe)-imidazoG37] synthetase (radical SAM superfamily)